MTCDWQIFFALSTTAVAGVAIVGVGFFCVIGMLICCILSCFRAGHCCARWCVRPVGISRSPVEVVAIEAYDVTDNEALIYDKKKHEKRPYLSISEMCSYRGTTASRLLSAVGCVIGGVLIFTSLVEWVKFGNLQCNFTGCATARVTLSVIAGCGVIALCLMEVNRHPIYTVFHFLGSFAFVGCGAAAFIIPFSLGLDSVRFVQTARLSYAAIAMFIAYIIMRAIYTCVGAFTTTKEKRGRHCPRDELAVTEAQSVLELAAVSAKMAVVAGDRAEAAIYVNQEHLAKLENEKVAPAAAEMLTARSNLQTDAARADYAVHAVTQSSLSALPVPAGRAQPRGTLQSNMKLRSRLRTSIRLTAKQIASNIFRNSTMLHGMRTQSRRKQQLLVFAAAGVSTPKLMLSVLLLSPPVLHLAH